MKYIKTYEFFKLFETIHPNEAYSDLNSLKTVLENKRKICLILKDKTFLKIAVIYNLEVIEVRKEDGKIPNCIIYTKDNEKNAKELEKIMLKYEGYCPWYATDEDSYRIGILLEYDEDEIKKYLIENRKLRKENNIENNDEFVKNYMEENKKQRNIKKFENFNDNDQSVENTPIDPVLKSQVTKYVDEQLGSQNFHEIFDIIGVDMPQTLEGEEFEEKMDLAKEKAIDFFMRNPERMQIDKPTEFRTFNIGKDNPIPTTTNIGGIMRN